MLCKNFLSSIVIFSLIGGLFFIQVDNIKAVENNEFNVLVSGVNNFNFKTTKLAIIDDSYRDNENVCQPQPDCFYDYFFDNIRFDPIGRRVAYRLLKAPEVEKENVFWKLMMNQDEIGAYPYASNYVDIDYGWVKFSDDGEHYVYGTTDKDGYLIVKDGIEYRKNGSDKNKPFFFLDSDKYFYYDNGDQFAKVYIADKEIKLVNQEIRSVRASGNNIALWVEEDENAYVILMNQNGDIIKEGKKFNKNSIEDYAVSENGDIFYLTWIETVQQNEKYKLTKDLFNGGIIELGEYNNADFLTISEDGQNWSLQVEYPENKFPMNFSIVINGKQSKIYADARNAIFSSDGSRIIYHASYGTHSDEEFLVINNQEMKDFYGTWRYKFTADSQHYVTVAIDPQDSEKEILVIDNNKKGDSYDEIYDFFISPDGKYVGYGARNGNELWWVVVNIEGEDKRINIDINLSNRLKGKLLLQVQDRGRVWYVNPDDAKKYEVTFANALNLFERLSLGVTNNDLYKIAMNIDSVSNEVDTDGDGYSDKSEVEAGYNPEIASNTNGNDKISIDANLSNRLKGKLLLQVEDRGRIWYVDFEGKRHEVTWKNLMSLFTRLSLGITNSDLDKIEISN